MGDRLRVSPGFVPAPGATVTPALLHRIVDDAVVSINTDGLSAGSGNIMAVTTYTLTAPSVQFNPDTACKMVHCTAVSELAIRPENLVTRSGLATYASFSAVSNVANTYKGLPGWFCRRTPSRNWPWDNAAGYSLPKYKIPHSAPAADDARSRFIFPIVTGDPKPLAATYADQYRFVAGNTFTSPKSIDAMTIFAGDSSVGEDEIQNIEVIFNGPAEALVHASLSSSFNKNDLYGVYYSLEDTLTTCLMRQPVSWCGSAITAATRCIIPWGVVRQVYTDSGVTMVQPPNGSGDYALAAQPYYVADIFFWGMPCL